VLEKVPQFLQISPSSILIYANSFFNVMKQCHYKIDKKNVTLQDSKQQNSNNLTASVTRQLLLLFYYYCDVSVIGPGADKSVRKST
jgi:hypothetical protein